MNSKIKILVDDKEIDYYTFTDELRNGDYFFKENGQWYLHKRPIIEEDKKIRKLNLNEFTDNNSLDEVDTNLDIIFDKINEIIDYINKEKENEQSE